MVVIIPVIGSDDTEHMVNKFFVIAKPDQVTCDPSFKHGSAAYSLDLAKWTSVPLYVKNYADNSVVNERFFYIFSRTVD